MTQIFSSQPSNHFPKDPLHGAYYKETKTLSLLVKLIVSEDYELKGNSILVQEYRQFAQELQSETSRLIIRQLIEKTKVIHVSTESINQCRPFLPPTESADIVHAATCLSARRP